MDEPLTRGAALAAWSVFIIPLVQLAKGAGLPDRFAPLAAVLLGLLGTFGVVYAFPGPPQVALVLLMGLGAGLTAAGLYSGVRASVQK